MSGDIIAKCAACGALVVPNRFGCINRHNDGVGKVCGMSGQDFNLAVKR